MRALILLVSIFSAAGISLHAQQMTGGDLSSDQREVLEVVLELFEAYRLGDAERAGAVFTANGQMQRVQQKDGTPMVTETGSVQGWIDYIRAGLSEVHDEPIWDYKVNIDGDMAHVWTKYAFYLGGKFHHCGVDSFLLVRKEDGWKIFHISDTSQTEGCDIPEKIKQKKRRYVTYFLLSRITIEN